LAVGSGASGTRGTVEIAADITTNTAYGILAFTNDSSTDTTNNKRVAQISASRNGNNNAADLHFLTNSGSSYDSRMIIDSSGNVGINTISASGPQSTFHIEQNGDDADGGFRLSRDNALASYTQYLDTSSNWNLAYGNPASDDAPTSYLTVTNGGNVGINTTSPTSVLHIRQPVDNSGLTFSHASRANEWEFELSGANNANFAFKRRLEDDTESTYYLFGTSGHFWYGGATGSSSERMRIDSDGNLLVGKTTTSFNTEGMILYGTSGSGSRVNITNTGNKTLNLNRLSSHGVLVEFYKDGSSVGSISTNANSLPSDRNFKKNIKDLQLGLSFISSLQPVTYNYKMDDDSDPIMTGLIAQDVEDALSAAGVEPNSMTLLQHNPVDDEKESDYQMDYSKLIPVLTKAIQEQQAIIEDLQTRLSALEAN
jgi:hypothetical protein